MESLQRNFASMSPLQKVAVIVLPIIATMGLINTMNTLASSSAADQQMIGSPFISKPRENFTSSQATVLPEPKNNENNTRTEVELTQTSDDTGNQESSLEVNGESVPIPDNGKVKETIVTDDGEVKLDIETSSSGQGSGDSSSSIDIDLESNSNEGSSQTSESEVKIRSR